LRDFLCQTFFLAAQKESLTQASAAATAAKENERKLYNGNHAASITRRGDCGSGPAMTLFFLRQGKCPAECLLSATTPTAALQLYFLKMATRQVIRRTPGTEKIRLGGCAVKKWQETMRILVTCESPGTV
jgi:hypothetical protein